MLLYLIKVDHVKQEAAAHARLKMGPIELQPSRSLLSKCVELDELGKLFTLLYVLPSIFGVGIKGRGIASGPPFWKMFD